MLLALPALLCPLLASASLPQDEPRPPIRIEDPSRMDAEVVATVQRAVEAVEAANAQEGDGAVAERGRAWSTLGIAYEANTMWSLALPCYAEATRLLPDKPEWLYRRGVCELSMGDLEQALATFREVSPKLSNTAIVQARHGEAAWTMGLLDEAKDAWQRAIDSEQSLSGDLKFPESRVGLAQVLIEFENWDPAEILLREALSMNPGYPHAHYLLGIVLAEKGDDVGAEFELQLGLNAYPMLPPDPHAPLLAQWKAGYGQRMMNIENQLAAGDAPGALTALAEIQAERPEDFMVLNLMSRAHQAMGDFAGALARLEESLAISPDEYMTQVDLAVVLLNMASQPNNAAQKPELVARARTAAEKGVALAPHIGRTWYYRGLVEYVGMDPNDPQAAQQAVKATMTALQRAHLLGCREPQLLELLAQLYAQQGNTGEMVKFAQAHTKHSPENPLAWIFLARAQFTVNEYEAARVALDRAVATSGRDPQVVSFQQQMEAAIQQAQAQKQ